MDDEQIQAEQKKSTHWWRFKNFCCRLRNKKTVCLLQENAVTFQSKKNGSEVENGRLCFCLKDNVSPNDLGNI
jgi:hypothetical protein